MRFYERFASAYGTLMLGMVIASLFSNRVIHLGKLGLIGFPVAALIYAIEKNQLGGQ